MTCIFYIDLIYSPADICIQFSLWRHDLIAYTGFGREATEKILPLFLGLSFGNFQILFFFIPKLTHNLRPCPQVFFCLRYILSFRLSCRGYQEAFDAPLKHYYHQ